MVSDLKRYGVLLADANARGAGKSSLLIILTDLFSEVFGYDKYTDVVLGFEDGSIFDLTIKSEGAIEILVKVVEARTSVSKERVSSLASGFSNSGAKWIVLTDGLRWLCKPLGGGLDLSDFNFDESRDLALLYPLPGKLLKREGFSDIKISAAAKATNNVRRGEPDNPRPTEPDNPRGDEPDNRR